MPVESHTKLRDNFVMKPYSVRQLGSEKVVTSSRNKRLLLACTLMIMCVQNGGSTAGLSPPRSELPAQQDLI